MKLSELSPEQKRDLIRNHLGWGDASRDPLTNLDAMHKAELTLGHWPNLQTLNYLNKLNEICKVSKTNTWSATATQRADAFLLTLNLAEP